MFLIWLLAILIILFYGRYFIKWRNGPPGPLPFPIVGNLFQLMMGPKQLHLAIARLSQIYGDFFRIQIGSKDFVLASSIDSIVKLYSREEVLERDRSGTLYDRSSGRNTGIIQADGETWDVNRKWTFKTLNKLGLRKGSGIEEAINEQCGIVVKSWKNTLAGSTWVTIDVAPAFLLYVTKVVFKLVMGDRMNDSNNGVLLEKLIHLSDKMAKSTTLGVGLDAAFPLLRYVAPKLTGRNIQMECYTSIREAAKKLLDDVRKEQNTSFRDSPKTLTHAYIREMDSNHSTHLFSDFHFGSIYMDLLQAASETTNSYLQSLILFSVVHAAYQDQIYDEIISVLGESDLVILLEHRKLMPFTDAFMLETHRHTNVFPSLLPHKVTADFTIGNYMIPKDTQILADMHSANFDKKVWKNPLEFDPTRFFDSNGNVSSEKRKLCIPFGVGRRACPGESVAEWTAFLFLANIIRIFKLSVIPGESPPTTEMNVGITAGPFPFRVAISKRN